MSVDPGGSAALNDGMAKPAGSLMWGQLTPAMRCYDCEGYERPTATHSDCTTRGIRKAGYAAACKKNKRRTAPDRPTLPERRTDMVSPVTTRKAREGSWTPEEDEILRTKRNLGRKNLAELLDRSESAIMNRLHVLKKTYPDFNAIAPQEAAQEPSRPTDSPVPDPIAAGPLEQLAAHEAREAMLAIDPDDAEFVEGAPLPEEHAYVVCRECGATDSEICETGRRWIEADLCSGCADSAKGDPYIPGSDPEELCDCVVDLVACRVCGATDEGCAGGLTWAEPDLCQSCADDMTDAGADRTTRDDLLHDAVDNILQGEAAVTITIADASADREHILRRELIDTHLAHAHELLSGTMPGMNRIIKAGDAIDRVRDLMKAL